MTVLRNNFSTGPDGTTITAANSNDVPGDDAFDAVNFGTAATGKYSTDHARPTAEFTGKFATGATSTVALVGWTTSMGTQTQFWFREYFYLTAAPSGFDARVFSIDDGVNPCGAIQIQATTGKLIVLNGTGSQTSTSVSGLLLNTWIRIEARFQISTTTGNWDVNIYGEPDSDTPTESMTASSWNMGAANAATYAFGYTVLHTNQPLLYLSGLEINTTDFPGPAPFRQGLGYPMGNLTNSVAPICDAS